MKSVESRKILEDIVGKAIRKLTERQNLTADEAEQAFITLFKYDLDSYFFLKFTAAFHTKEEINDKLPGFCKTNEWMILKVKVNIDPKNIFETSGTGGDRIKTPNVGTATTFILASANVCVAKQAFCAVTGFTGNTDLLGTFGIDVMSISKSEFENVIKILKKEGIDIICLVNSRLCCTCV